MGAAYFEDAVMVGGRRRRGVGGALRQLGIPSQVIQRALERGDPEGAIFEAVVLAASAERTVSAIEIERAGGLTASEIAALMEAFGLPAPDPAIPAFSPREADVLIELARMVDIWPPDLRTRGARVYGRQLARIAHTEVQEFRAHVQPRLTSHRDDRLRGLRALKVAFDRLLPIAELLLVGVHQRWVEHELGQAVVHDAESAVGGRELPGAVDVTIVFCDLKDFTAYADLEGDAAAIDVIDRLSEVVLQERGEHVRLMKSLGDGFMLSYGDTHDAVAATARIVAAMRDDETPGVHASVHRGIAIAREGDYFGGAVNLAARLLAAAGRDELVATEPVVDATRGAFDWQPAGTRRVRGVTEPVEIYRLRDGRAPRGQRGRVTSRRLTAAIAMIAMTAGPTPKKTLCTHARPW